MSNPSVNTRSTAWEPKIVAMFPWFRRRRGSSTPNTMTTTSQAATSPKRSSSAESRGRRAPHAGTRAPSRDVAAVRSVPIQPTFPEAARPWLRAYRHAHEALLGDAVFRQVRSDELARDPSARDDHHAITDRGQLLVICACTHDGSSGARRVPDHRVDLLPCAHVDAQGGLVQQDQCRAPSETTWQ